MKLPMRSVLVILVTVTISSTGWGADRMVGVIPTDGATMFVKRFEVAAGTTITGVQFENNDGATTFPEVALIRGPLSAIADGTPVASATQVRPGAGIVTAAWSSPVTASVAGTYYAVVRFPAGQGKQGVGRGPALSADNVAAPNGSYVAGSATEPLVPAKLDLRIALVTSGSGGANKAGGADPEMPPIETPAVMREELTVRSAGGRLPATVRFGLVSESDVILSVYDVSGRLVHEITRGSLPAGVHEREWREVENARTPAGVYFVRLEASGRTLTQKVVIAH